MLSYCAGRSPEEVIDNDLAETTFSDVTQRVPCGLKANRSCKPLGKSQRNNAMKRIGLARPAFWRAQIQFVDSAGSLDGAGPAITGGMLLVKSGYGVWGRNA
jgi:hypothetical protein